jgi:hypothetical protein
MSRDWQFSECCDAPIWRKNIRTMGRCTACGHRKITDGLAPVKTRFQPWRIPAEIIGRCQARKAGGILRRIQVL